MGLQKISLFTICVFLLVSDARCWLKKAEGERNWAELENILAEEMEIEVLEESDESWMDWAVNIVSEGIGMNSNNAKDAIDDASKSTNTHATDGSNLVDSASEMLDNAKSYTSEKVKEAMNIVSDGTDAMKNKANDATLNDAKEGRENSYENSEAREAYLADKEKASDAAGNTGEHMRSETAEL